MAELICNHSSTRSYAKIICSKLEFISACTIQTATAIWPKLTWKNILPNWFQLSLTWKTYKNNSKRSISSVPLRNLLSSLTLSVQEESILRICWLHLFLLSFTNWDMKDINKMSIKIGIFFHNIGSLFHIPRVYTINSTNSMQIKMER